MKADGYISQKRNWFGFDFCIVGHTEKEMHENFSRVFMDLLVSKWRKEMGAPK